jgi:regulator of sigma E protease
VYGLPVLVPEIGDIMPDTPAERAGLKKQDRITEINGTRISQWDEMTEIIHQNPGKQLQLTLLRNGKSIQILITPERKKAPDIFGEGKEVGLIGIKPSGSTFTRKSGLKESVVSSVRRTWEITALTIVSVVKLIQRVLPMNTLGGPIMILQMAGEQASQGILNFLVLMAIININLGVLNLLPIPILDGGHILFLGIEAIRRKPLEEKIMGIAQRIGLALIIMLFGFVLYNYFMRIIFPWIQRIFAS